MRFLRFVVPVIASIAICSGCSNSEPTGRLVICNHSGGILGDISFPARRPPSVDEICRRLNALVPTLPKDGQAIRVAAAIMDDPSDEFGKAKTLSDFSNSLSGSHRSYMAFASFDVVNEGRGVVVWQHDPGKWTDKPVAWQMKNANRSEYWRNVLAEQFASVFFQSASSYADEHRLQSLAGVH